MKKIPVENCSRVEYSLLVHAVSHSYSSLSGGRNINIVLEQGYVKKTTIFVVVPTPLFCSLVYGRGGGGGLVGANSITTAKQHGMAQVYVFKIT